MDKRDLKAYIRYDKNGRVISGGPRMNRFKPKSGGWEEIDAYLCCNPPPPPPPCILNQYQFTVTQADIDDATGNTGIDVIGPNGNLWNTANRFWYSFYVSCNGSNSSGSSVATTDTRCAIQTPYVWYFKNDAVVLINTIVNTGPCP